MNQISDKLDLPDIRYPANLLSGTFLQTMHPKTSVELAGGLFG